ncbi:DNA-directed RNA polymerase subunit alpha C-terminal domain-containing protein [Comamonas sp. JUb58]|jgi:DNA-directed RNA polymerase alpha subunit|uniref:DNA-directed RNA polymerase subunit alpha C-terminal domain-containing protein n=1 Tax=Comamonas sp. JUb58 TaxID=2485114 RepID=UPI00105F4BF2|nr:DNA-directed RNA polymerase subunit alpha C-terminal domain-containing protein [Comamonas sp. JUb58]TDS68876.1 RNA polymerase alpha subunit [Comamonas sp. JUb58]
MSPLNDAQAAHATPLAGKLSNRAFNALARHNITTVEEVIAAYPERLLKLAGFGLQSLREVEAVFFPGQCYLAELKDGQRPTKKMHGAPLIGLGLHPAA